MKKKKDSPLEKLEKLAEWNGKVSETLLRPLSHDWKEFSKLTRSISELFDINEDTIHEIIKELKKKKK